MALSKNQVDRAGRKFTNHVFALLNEEPDLELGEPEVRRVIEVIETWRSEHARPLSRVSANLRHYAGLHGRPVVAQRLKRVPAIAGKLIREPSMKLSRMGDIGGVRAVMPSQSAAYDVANRLRRNWTITKFRDYVAEPKDDGYRALHLVNRNRGRLIEIQLRTEHQDLWANNVEKLSRQAIPGLKFGEGPLAVREYLSDTAKILSEEDQGLAPSSLTLDRMKARAIEAIKLPFGDPDEP